jgi:uncharacterized membrane protein
MATRARDAERARGLATGLGLFSLGLGVAQLAAPGRVNRAIGVRDDARSRFWQRVVGVQELSAAAGILGPPPTRPFLWGRTAGDVQHIAMLAFALRGRGQDPARLAAAIASVAGCLGADALASVRSSAHTQHDDDEEAGPMEARAAITINESLDAVMRGWRAFEEEADGPARLGPVEVVDETPGRAYGWRTTEGSDVSASGVAVFAQAPEGRGTEIHLELNTGSNPLRKVTGDDPLQVVRDDLRRFKQLVETGQVTRSDGAPSGHSAKLQPKQRPAQPVEA